MKNEAENLNKNHYNVTANSFCALAGKVLPSQKFEHEL
jgi:hypothetical protein